MEIATLDQLGTNIAELKNSKKVLEDQLKKVNSELENYQQQMIEHLLDSGKSAWQIQGIGLLSVKSTTYYSVEDKDKVVQFFQKSNPGMLTVNHMTLSAWARELPEEYDLQKIGLKSYIKTSISYKKE